MDHVLAICSLLGVEVEQRIFVESSTEEVLILYYINGIEYHEDNLDGFLSFLYGYLYAMKGMNT